MTQQKGVAKVSGVGVKIVNKLRELGMWRRKTETLRQPSHQRSEERCVK